MGEVVIDREKLNKFEMDLAQVNLCKEDKDSILFALEYLTGKHDSRLTSRSFLLYGDSGIGKTHFILQLLEMVQLPVLYLSNSKIPGKQRIRCRDFSEFLRKAEQLNAGILFIDDIIYQASSADDDMPVEFSTRKRQQILAVLESMRRPGRRSLLFITANEVRMDVPMLDRIEVKIEFPLPTAESKRQFLTQEYREYLQEEDLIHLAKETAGYSFRDVPEVIKLAYRKGQGEIRLPALNAAIKQYIPSTLRQYQVVNGLKLQLDSIIGREHIKRALRMAIWAVRNHQQAKQLGIRRGNLLLFYGPPGTGKTFAVKALAGELGFPMVNFRAQNLFDGSPFQNLTSLMSVARRFNNCIIFIDEAEKMFGRPTLGEDDAMQGEIQSALEGLDRETNAIVVLAMNNINRFGRAFRDRFMEVRFNFPDDAERLGFLGEKIRAMPETALKDEALQEIARRTKGFSFRDLERLWNEVTFRRLEGAEITIDTFSAVISEMKKESQREDYTYG